MKRKTTAAIFLIFAVLMVMFFTFQEPERSRALSEAARVWLANIRIEVEYKSLRSNIHILAYFTVGLAVCAFCRSRGWKAWNGAAIGCGIGVVDEGIKVLLPGREFSGMDLVKDFIGVGIAVLIATFICLLRRREDHG